MEKKSGRWKLILLFSLYFSQGLPFGFQATALPLYIRDSGASLELVGMLGLLSLPWFLKFLWSPLVDRFYFSSFGKRKSWIVPLQILLVTSVLLAAFVSENKSIWPLFGVVLMINFIVATQDIAVDGLAVDILDEKQLGYGNVSQVVGYKVGMLLGGGILIYISGMFGLAPLFVAMAVLSCIPLALIIFFKEGKRVEKNKSFDGENRLKIAQIFLALKDFFRAKNALWILLLVIFYKFGEAIMDTMYKPFLLDIGFTKEQIGLWMGTYGMVASLAGSFYGGYLAKRISVWPALGGALFVRAFPLFLEFLISNNPHPSSQLIIVVSCLEHFAGGVLTVTMFAYLMSVVNKEIGATHYTVLASLEVFVRFPFKGYTFSWLI